MNLDALPEPPEPNLPLCHAGRDGECYWEECPQLTNRQSYCRYAKAWEEFWESMDMDIR